MTPGARFILALTALISFTGLAITMLCLGQPANAIGSLVLAIVVGVTQLMQAMEGPARGRGSRPQALVPAEDRKAETEIATANDTDDTDDAEPADGGGAEDDEDEERPAA
ncbi:hypothetical protein AAW14_19060 [Streptomyces hygroscopicus]|uniref:hypothetical protein n=1 Tax=Streptomyces hygroscopicus TaxID=1912 RepID=UPI0022408220|nr:hypothetical protein [Streptomyces hygroscopicus]MCW7944076.1 hypothetical protein [Streptomyces hygroscopicus]